MPTPPTGDMACAASPMQSSPGREPLLSRSTVTVSNLTSSQLADRPSGRRRNGAAPARAERVQPLRLDRVEAALSHHVGALEVVAAVEHHQHMAGDRCVRAAFRSSARRGRRIQSTSIGAPMSWTSSPARSRTGECRPSAAIDEIGRNLDRARVRSARDAGDRSPSAIKVDRLGVHPQLEVREAPAPPRRGNSGNPTAASWRRTSPRVGRWLKSASWIVLVADLAARGG